MKWLSLASVFFNVKFYKKAFTIIMYISLSFCANIQIVKLKRSLNQKCYKLFKNYNIVNILKHYESLLISFVEVISMCSVKITSLLMHCLSKMSMSLVLLWVCRVYWSNFIVFYIYLEKIYANIVYQQVVFLIFSYFITTKNEKFYNFCFIIKIIFKKSFLAPIFIEIIWKIFFTFFLILNLILSYRNCLLRILSRY